MTKWLLMCKKCNTKWVLDVSYDLRKMSKLYYYCATCKTNTFHEVLGIVEEN